MTYHLMCLFICNYIIICYNYNGGRMKKIAINIFICLYVLLTILITYCLLSYNDYNIAELKNKTLLIFENKENNYKKSDLLIVKKNSDITKGEQIFYYDKYDNPVKVSLGKVVNIEKIDGLNIKCHCYFHYIGFEPSLYIDSLQNQTAFRPATKEESERLFRIMKEDGYEWSSDQRKLIKIK